MLRILIILAILSFSIDADAQKKELSEAKTYLKKNTSLDKAENLVRKAILMPGLKTRTRPTHSCLTSCADNMRHATRNCISNNSLTQHHCSPH